MESGLRFDEYRGGEITPHIPTIGRLRIAVFREFPYLYDGDEGAEREYLRTYAEAAGIDVSRICYFGESVLLPSYRGRGVGREFFRLRLKEAGRNGLPVTTFCAVDRPTDHPSMPRGYRPLDDFWRSLGYIRQPGMRASFPWRETGDDRETDHTLTFWARGKM